MHIIIAYTYRLRTSLLLFISSLLVFNAHFAFAQDSNIITNRIIRQLQLYPQEKTYVHTDANHYIPSDRIWLKVYVVEALSHIPTNESRYAYVELISPNGALVSRIKLKENEGAYFGYLDIPANAKTGRYVLRSYTLPSASVENYESIQYIYIGTSKLNSVTETKGYTNLYDPAKITTPSPISFKYAGKEIIVSTTLPNDSLYMLAHCRAFPFACKPISITQPIVLDKDSIPQGIISLLLINRYGNLLGSCMLLSANDRERLRLPLIADKPIYKVGGHVHINFDEALLHKGERVDLSVSVRAEQKQDYPATTNILAHFFLSTDITKFLPHAAYFYMYPNRADSLLSNENWMRYNFSNVLKGVYQYGYIKPEQDQMLCGKVRSLLFHQPIVNAKVSIIVPSIGQATATTTDSDGTFCFKGLDLPQQTEYLINASKPNGKENIELIIHENDYPALPTKEKIGECEDTIPAIFGQTENEKDYGGVLLKNVDVVKNKTAEMSRSDAYSRLSEFSFGLKDIEEIDATCMHELLRRVPGIFVRQEKCYIRAVTTVHGEQHPAAIVVDGVFMEEEFDLDRINMMDVARVDIYKSSSTVIWGSRGGSGVISITTRQGGEAVKQVAKLNQQKVVPLGFQSPIDFSRLTEASRTIWWSPTVSQPFIEFDTSARIGNYHITVEGVTNEGRLVYEECDIKCED